MNEESKIISALDLGSSKTTVLVAQLDSSGNIDLIGVGVAPSSGIKAGGITNIETTVKSIKTAIEEAEIMSGIEINSVVTNVTGKHVHGDNSIGVIAITNKDRIINKSDIFRVVEAAQSIRIPADQEILHVLSKFFRVDDQGGIKDPTGMLGVRLEADVHIVTGSSTYMQNMDKAIHESGLGVSDRILSALASSYSELSEGEKELGVAVVDIGAGIIDIIIYIDGGVTYTSTIGIGSQHMTQDISIGLKTPMESAEILKKRYGTVLSSMVDKDESIEVPSVGDRSPRMTSRKHLAEIMEARMRELLELIDNEISRSGQKNRLAGGIILTGGGSLVDGMTTLAEEVINLGAAIGHPKGFSGIVEKISSPIFSTATGLILYAAQYTDFKAGNKRSKGFLDKMKNWIQDNL
ncbi:MAG: cell division protein FtsA [Spirochaetia bacterium]|nr:cell division protein FtsA [Spirochaetia bacterium]